jgi:ribosome-binding protein aMBF1 (putative translation factor)
MATMQETSLERARATVMERIRQHLKSPGVTKKGLAGDAKIHPNTLQGVDDHGWNPTDATLIAIERTLPIELRIAS